MSYYQYGGDGDDNYWDTSYDEFYDFEDYNGYFDDQDFEKALCYKYFDNGSNKALQSQFNQCLSNPSATISSEVRDFVEKINNPVPNQIGLEQKGKISVSVGTTYNVDQSQSWGSKKLVAVVDSPAE